MSESLHAYRDEFLTDDELRTNAAAFRRREDPAPAGRQVELVVFRLDAHWLALPTTAVREVAPARPPTRLPECPPAVLGLSNLRGTILVVLDLRPLLGYGPASGGRRRRLLVLEDRVGPTAAGRRRRPRFQVRCGVEQFRPLPQARRPGPWPVAASPRSRASP
jgi:chemotaxis signal transduction protein